MNTYWLKRFRKKAKKKFSIRETSGCLISIYKLNIYNEWEQVSSKSYGRSELPTAVADLAEYRREYIIKLALKKRTARFNKLLAKL